MKEILAHFKKVDPTLHAAARGATWYDLSRPHDRFTGLCRIIIGQQVSTKAARSIFEKFSSLFPRKRPTAAAILNMTDSQLRSAGLSASKAASIRDLATRVHSKTLPLSQIHKLDDANIITRLTAVRGIGPWSAEMFLLFYLNKTDVFSPGDLGLRTAIMKLYKKRSLPSPEAAARLSKRWSPYRSYACRILWESLDNNPS